MMLVMMLAICDRLPIKPFSRVPASVRAIHRFDHIRLTSDGAECWESADSRNERCTEVGCAQRDQLPIRGDE